jgi:hypothetical protein
MAQSFRESLDEIMDQTIDPGEALPTKIEMVPEGTVAEATVVGIRPIVYQSGDDGSWNAMYEFTYSINDPSVKEETQLEDPRVVHIVRLDVRKDWDGKGAPPLTFGPNKNVELGKVREAFGTNTAKPFKLSDFMHETTWLRVGRPRREEDRYAPVVMLGHDEEDVTPRKRR